MFKSCIFTALASLTLGQTVVAQKGGSTGPCGKDIICAELKIWPKSGLRLDGDSTGVSTYRDYRTTGGDPCVLAEYRTRYNLFWVNTSRDQQTGCTGARAVTLTFPTEICSYLTSPMVGYTSGDGHYTDLVGGGCSLELRTTNPRIRVDGFVPDAVNPKAGDVGVLFNNPHYTGSGAVTCSSFTVDLVNAPVAAPNGLNSTKVDYSGDALLHSYVSGRLDSKKDKKFGAFSLELDLNLVP